MIDRLKLLLGLGPHQAYLPLSLRQKITLLVVDIVFIVMVVAVDSWVLRGLLILALIAVSLVMVAPRRRRISGSGSV